MERLLPSLALELPDPRPGHGARLRVMLRGRTEALVGLRGSLLLEPRERPSVARARARREERGGLRGFLDHLLLTASGETVSRHAVHVLYPGEPRPIEVGLAGLSEERAREYLSMLVADLLTLAQLEGSPRPQADRWVPMQPLLRRVVALGNLHVSTTLLVVADCGQMTLTM